MKLKDANYKSHWNILVFATNEKWCQIWIFWICPMENVWFCFTSIVWVYFSHKTEKFWFWKSLKQFNVFDEKRYGVRFKYAPWKNVWPCFISNVWVHFTHKTEKFRFWKSLKYFFDKKEWCYIWICPVKQCLIWFKLRCLSKTLAIVEKYGFGTLLK